MTPNPKKYILGFSGIGIKDVPLVGGKNASLGETYKQFTQKGSMIFWLVFVFVAFFLTLLIWEILKLGNQGMIVSIVDAPKGVFK